MAGPRIYKSDSLSKKEAAHGPTGFRELTLHPLTYTPKPQRVMVVLGLWAASHGSLLKCWSPRKKPFCSVVPDSL